MRSTGTPYLLRPPALPGESLSSWRQRVGRTNGYTLFPVLDERTRRADPDLGVYPSDLHWIAGLHGTDFDQVVAMSFRSLIGRVVSDLGPRSQPTWWLRTRMGAANSAFGPMYCPHCLAADQTAYFRLKWRLGFLTRCEVHHTLLLDRCPSCGCAPWPAGCGIQGAVQDQFTSFRHCWHCGSEIGSTIKRSTTCESQSADAWLSGSSVRLGSISVPTIEALQALRAIGQLFLRNRSMQLIRESANEWAQVLGQMSAAAGRAQAVEHLNVEDRDVLVPATMRVLSQWPTSFVWFCQSVGVSRAHFNGSGNLHPLWMSDVIDRHLARQNRFVSRETINAVIQRHQQAQGTRPTVTALRAELGWQGDKGLEEFYPPRRGQATQHEWQAFVGACLHALESTDAEPLRSSLALLHDLSAIIIELLKASGMRVPSEMNREHMTLFLRRAREEWIVEGTHLAQLVDRTLAGVASAISRSTRVFASEGQSARQTAKRFRSLTSQLPADLDREASVFVHAVRKDGLIGVEAPGIHHAGHVEADSPVSDQSILASLGLGHAASIEEAAQGGAN